MRYHKGERFGLPGEWQSYLYWMGLNYYRLSEGERRLIRETAAEVCADRSLVPALLAAVTTERTLAGVAVLHYTSASALQRLCGAYYRRLSEKLKEKR